MTGKFAAHKIAFLILVLFLVPASLMKSAAGSPQQPYTLEPIPTTEFSVAPPTLPDLSLYTTDHIKTLAPKLVAGQVEWQLLWDSPEFKNLQIKEDVDFVANRQGNDDPFWIVIRSGVYDLPGLYSTINDESVITKKDDGYLIKAPLMIAKSAGLILQGSTQKLYLSTHDGAMITSYGQFFAIDTLITSWDDKANAPSDYDDKKNSFRPYLQFLNDSVTYIAGTSIQHLGYDSSKGFGLSFSANENLLTNKDDHTPIAMTGWVVDNRITDLYYGYYTFMADGLAVVGNKFKDNIIYGIDPHDYSRNLVIANNDVSGTRKKHGIIISRNVNHSFIIHNKSYNNHGSGIMLDRQCSNNVIAHNVVEKNQADGIFFSESSNNLSYQNTVKKNKRSGIRLRNSRDITSYDDKILDNQKAGVVLYTADLGHTERNIVQDPYEQRTTMRLIGTTFSNNDGSHIDLENFDTVDFYHISTIKTPTGHVFSGPDDIPFYSLQDKIRNIKEGVRLQKIPSALAVKD